MGAAGKRARVQWQSDTLGGGAVAWRQWSAAAGGGGDGHALHVRGGVGSLHRPAVRGRRRRRWGGGAAGRWVGGPRRLFCTRAWKQQWVSRASRSGRAAGPKRRRSPGHQGLQIPDSNRPCRYCPRERRVCENGADWQTSKKSFTPFFKWITVDRAAAPPKAHPRLFFQWPCSRRAAVRLQSVCA